MELSGGKLARENYLLLILFPGEHWCLLVCIYIVFSAVHLLAHDITTAADNFSLEIYSNIGFSQWS